MARGKSAYQAGVPPSGLPGQLKNLSAKLDDFSEITQLEAGVTSDEIGNKLNEVIVALQAIRLNYQPNAKKL